MNLEKIKNPEFIKQLNICLLYTSIQEAHDKMVLAGYEIRWLLLEGHCQGSSMI